MCLMACGRLYPLFRWHLWDLVRLGEAYLTPVNTLPSLGDSGDEGLRFRASGKGERAYGNWINSSGKRLLIKGERPLVTGSR